ncbi:hypothetical protein GCM10007171_16220 [Dickeya fangzhongdai]|nr:hypothetical protein GCM10007171_16220 [Dickeya fangzhongdai]
MLADRGLTQIEPVGRRGKAAFPYHRGKGFQQFQIQPGHIKLSFMTGISVCVCCLYRALVKLAEVPLPHTLVDAARGLSLIANSLF